MKTVKFFALFLTLLCLGHVNYSQKLNKIDIRKLFKKAIESNTSIFLENTIIEVPSITNDAFSAHVFSHNDSYNVYNDLIDNYVSGQYVKNGK